MARTKGSKNALPENAKKWATAMLKAIEDVDGHGNMTIAAMKIISGLTESEKAKFIQGLLPRISENKNENVNHNLTAMDELIDSMSTEELKQCLKIRQDVIKKT